jgi:hypothetical protein
MSAGAASRGSLIGSANTTMRTRAGWLARLKQRPCRYVALDGGSGAHLLAALAGRHPFVQQVASPRHADLLVIIEPVTQLVPAVVELARLLPHPARALLISTQGTDLDSFSGDQTTFMGQSSRAVNPAATPMTATLSARSVTMVRKNGPECRQAQRGECYFRGCTLELDHRAHEHGSRSGRDPGAPFHPYRWCDDATPEKDLSIQGCVVRNRPA